MSDGRARAGAGMTREEFEERRKTILNECKSLRTSLAAIGEGYDERVHAEVAEHDPILADFLKEAQFAQVEALDRLIRYAANRVEN